MILSYRIGRGLLYRLNPTTKLVVGLCAIVTAFLIPHVLGTVVFAGAVWLLVALGGGGSRISRTALLIVAPVSISLLVIHSLFYPDRQTVLLMIGPVAIWAEGLAFAVAMISRIAVLVLVVLAVVMTIPSKVLAATMVDRGLSPKFAYVFLATLQMIPDVHRRLQATLEAQQSRGLDVRANLRRRIRSLLAILGPLFQGTLVAAETRSLALEARAFGRKGPRTSMVESPADPKVERVVRYAAVAGVLALIVGTLLGPR